jgi:hypothetical protein
MTQKTPGMTLFDLQEHEVEISEDTIDTASPALPKTLPNHVR